MAPTWSEHTARQAKQNQTFTRTCATHIHTNMRIRQRVDMGNEPRQHVNTRLLHRFSKRAVKRQPRLRPVNSQSHVPNYEKIKYVKKIKTSDKHKKTQKITVVRIFDFYGTIF